MTAQTGGASGRSVRVGRLGAHGGAEPPPRRYPADDAPDVSRLRAQLDHERLERAKAEADLQRLTAIVARQEEELSGQAAAVPGGGRLAELEARLREQEERHRSEKEELERRRTEDMSKQWNEHWRRVQELEELRGDEDSHSERQREKLHDLERENAELRSKLQSNKGVRQQLEHFEQQMRHLEEGVAARDRDVAALEKEIAEKDALLASLRGGRPSGGDSSVSAEVALLRGQLEERDTELALLREHHAQLQRSGSGGSSASAASGRLQERLSAAVEELCAARASEERAVRRARELEAAVAAFEKDREQVSSQQSLLAAKERQVEELRRSVADLQWKLKQREDVVQLQKALIDEKLDQVVKLQALVEALRSQVLSLGGNPTDSMAAGVPRPARDGSRRPPAPTGVGSANTYTGPGGSNTYTGPCGYDARGPSSGQSATLSGRHSSSPWAQRRGRDGWLPHADGPRSNTVQERSRSEPRSDSVGRRRPSDDRLLDTSAMTAPPGASSRWGPGPASDHEESALSEEHYRRRSSRRMSDEDDDPMLRTLRGGSADGRPPRSRVRDEPPPRGPPAPAPRRGADAAHAGGRAPHRAAPAAGRRAAGSRSGSSERIQTAPVRSGSGCGGGGGGSFSRAPPSGGAARHAAPDPAVRRDPAGRWDARGAAQPASRPRSRHSGMA